VNKTLTTMLSLFVLMTASLFPTRAHAAWTYLAIQPGADQHYAWARVCKTYAPGPYGNLWKITYHVYRVGPTWPGQYIRAQVNRAPNNFFSTANNQWLYGVVAGVDFYASIDLKDTVQFLVSTPDGGGLWAGRWGKNFAPYDPALFQTC
jgi:hypothetical protein